MKIVHLAKYYLPHLGGVEIHLKEINSLLVKMGHEVTVITEQHDLKVGASAKYNGVKVIRIPKDFSEKKQKTWKFIKEHEDLFLEADVVHVHDVFWWILPVYKSIRKKVFITFHGWETEYPVRFNAKLQRYLYAKLARGSIHIGEWIQEFYWDKPSFISYGGINAKRLTRSKTGVEGVESGVGDSNSGSDGKFGVQANKKLVSIAFIGRLSKDNDVCKYIELVKILKSRNKNVEITWVGEGELREGCEKLGKVTGFVKNVSKYLVGRDLVFSSSYLSILEAQLLGSNVCAFYSNDLKKVYLESFPGSKHMLVSDDVSAMIKKINFLLRSPKLKREAGMKAKEFAKKQSWRKVVEVYLGVWG